MSEEIKNKQFHSDMDRIFESYLRQDEEPKVVIKDLKKDKILEKMDYSKVLFDSDLNIYKNVDGKLEKVNNPNFQAIVVKK